jgi:hypothetical protein
MTSLEKTFVFGGPIRALASGGAALLGFKFTSNHTSPPPSIDLSKPGSGNVKATPQRPWIDPNDQDQVVWNSADGNTYWVEFGANTCVNNPTDTGNNIQVPQTGSTNGLSRLYQVPAVAADDNYIVCDAGGAMLAGGSMGLHVKP